MTLSLAKVQIWFQQQEENGMYKNIMVAVDHSPQSPQVLDEAIKLAKMSGARLHVVTIANLYEFAFDEAGRRDEGRLRWVPALDGDQTNMAHRRRGHHHKSRRNGMRPPAKFFANNGIDGI